MLNFKTFTKQFAFPLWGWYLGGIVALALTNIITLEIPQAAKSVINRLGPDIDTDATRRLALMIIGLGLAQMLVRGLSRVLMFWPGRDLEARARAFLFGRAMSLPYHFFLRFGMGDLISRLSNDLGQLRIFYAFGMLQFINLVFLTIFTVSKMMASHMTLTIVAMVPTLSMLVITRFVWPSMQRYSRMNQDAMGRLTNRVTEAFVNVHAIQANAADAAFIERAEQENREVYRTNMKVIMVRTVFFPLMTCLTGVAQLSVLFYGSYEVVAGRLTVGDILAFNIYLAYLSFPLSAMGILVAIYQRSVTALERLSPFVDEPSEQALEGIPGVGNGSTPTLEIKNLNFSYGVKDGKARLFALNDVSFKVARGRRVGIFGPVGSGKTTLFNLITRIESPPAGTAYFGGRDVLMYEPTKLRAALGYGLQTVHLFSDSIAGNLAFGIQPPPDRAAMEMALQRADILEEVQHFEGGLDTQIGEKGIRLSGGQKQRIALARLLLRKPNLLILDDVLAAVDNQTERRIMDYIHQSGASLLIASHRASALKSCDEILIMHDGRITDRGSYDLLVTRHPELREDHSNGS